jgi:hypothetical protein
VERLTITIFKTKAQAKCSSLGKFQIGFKHLPIQHSMRPLPHHMPCRCPLKVVRLRVHPPRVAIRGKRDVQVDHQRSYKWTSQPEILQRPYRALARRVFNLPLQDQRIPDAPARSNAVIVPCYRGAYFDLAALILCCSNGIAYTPRRVLGKAVSDTGFPLLYGTC